MAADRRAEGVMNAERTSFLKKRSKKLLIHGTGALTGVRANLESFLVLLFKKEHPFF
jgi:hypothetical protein